MESEGTVQKSSYPSKKQDPSPVLNNISRDHYFKYCKFLSKLIGGAGKGQNYNESKILLLNYLL